MALPTLDVLLWPQNCDKINSVVLSCGNFLQPPWETEAQGSGPRRRQPRSLGITGVSGLLIPCIIRYNVLIHCNGITFPSPASPLSQKPGVF